MCGLSNALSAISTVLGFTKSTDTSSTNTNSSVALNDNSAAADATEAQRKKNATAAGYQSTIATSGSGVTSNAQTQSKSLLGS